ncbi:Mannan-Binding Lectin Serine Protease 2 [Manis pentadactyla]|nr:Mannan-Binding Lectin Serine Protease 2 [Manis pentadactyla]
MQVPIPSQEDTDILILLFNFLNDVIEIANLLFLLPAINSTRTFMDSDDDGTAHLTGRRARSWERRSLCELCQLPSLHFLLR